jgi:hypothetical protein
MNLDCKHLCLYSQRLSTFKNWTGEISPEQLAEAGYFSTGDNITTCFSCKMDFKEWKQMENPWLVHWQKSPYCTFILNNCCKIYEEHRKSFIEQIMTHPDIENLIKNGSYTSDEIKEAMLVYQKEFEIVPRTIKAIETVTKEYINSKNCKND